MGAGSYLLDIGTSGSHLSTLRSLGFGNNKLVGEKKIILKKNGGFGLVKKMSDLQGGIHLAGDPYFLGKFAPYLQCVNIDVLVHLGFTCCLSCLWFVEIRYFCAPLDIHIYSISNLAVIKKTVQIDAIHKDQ